MAISLIRPQYIKKSDFAGNDGNLKYRLVRANDWEYHHLDCLRILLHLPFPFQYLYKRGNGGIAFSHLNKHKLTVRSVS